MDVHVAACVFVEFVVIAYLLVKFHRFCKNARVDLIDCYNVSKGPIVAKNKKSKKSGDKTILSKSEIEEFIGSDRCKIGSGGYGIVYKIEYKGSLACLKVSKKPGQSKTFMSEAKKLRQVDGAGRSPKLLAVANDATMMVTTFCEGVTIYKWLDCNPWLPKKLALNVLLEIAVALDDLHAKGLVHNDIKSDNVIVDYTDDNIFISIIDLGLSSTPGAPKFFKDATPTRYNSYPWYAPEVWFGLTTDPKSDVFSLGHMATEMIDKCTLGPDLMDHAITVLVDQMQHKVMKMRPTVLQLISYLQWIIDSCDD